MKKTGICENCGREVYTNKLNLCKRCHQKVGGEFLKQQEPEEIEEAPSLEDLGIETSDETPEEVKEETEEEKSEDKEKSSKEDKKE